MMTNEFMVIHFRLHAAVQTFALCSPILEPKLNIFLFQFGKFLTIRQTVQLVRVSGYQSMRGMGVVKKPERDNEKGRPQMTSHLF